MLNTLRLYHANGTPCADRSSCSYAEHTNVPPLCGAEPAGGTTGATVGGPVACDLPSGHPGPHLHAATGREYQAGRG